MKVLFGSYTCMFRTGRSAVAKSVLSNLLAAKGFNAAQSKGRILSPHNKYYKQCNECKKLLQALSNFHVIASMPQPMLLARETKCCFSSIPMGPSSCDYGQSQTLTYISSAPSLVFVLGLWPQWCLGAAALAMLMAVIDPIHLVGCILHFLCASVRKSVGVS
eukprot:1156700-Pelagomonas_calceolata.AAC.2